MFSKIGDNVWLLNTPEAPKFELNLSPLSPHRSLVSMAIRGRRAFGTEVSIGKLAKDLCIMFRLQRDGNNMNPDLTGALYEACKEGCIGVYVTRNGEQVYEPLDLVNKTYTLEDPLPE